MEIKGEDGDKICELKERKESRTISIRAKDGYAINKIYLSDIGERKITNSKSMDLTVRYEDLAGCNNVLEVTFAEDKPKQETAPASQKNPPAGSDAAGTKQRSEAPSQNNGSSGSGQTGNSSGSGGGNQSGGKTEAGSSKAQTAPQEQAKAPAEAAPQEQAMAPAEAAAPSAASSSQAGSGTGTVGDTGTDLFAFGQNAGNTEEAMMAAENNAQLAAPPVAAGGMQEITDDDLAGKKSGQNGILWTIVISVAGAGVIVGAIAGYVKLKRKWTE